MPLHLVAFSSSIATGSNLLKVSAVQSVFDTIQNNNLVVPALNNIVGMHAYGPHISRAQLQSPSLQSPGYPDIQPYALVVPAEGSRTQWISLVQNPLALKATEQLSAFSINSNSAAEQEYMALQLADKAPTPSSGRVITLKLTGSTTLVANTWTEVSLTFEDNLPVGNYDVVGFRAQSAGCIYARIGYPGFGYRPGTLGVQALNDQDVPGARYGGWGVWFTFSSTVVLSADFLSTSADTAETVYLDLVGPK